MYNRINSMSLNENDTNEPKLIAKGTYGCIFRPGLSCNGMINDKDSITKIQYDDLTSQNEKNMGKKIINELADEYDKYFSPIIEDCPVKVENLNEEMNKCELIKTGVPKKIPLQMSKIKYVGESDLKIYYSELNKTKNNYQILEKIIRGLRHNLIALKKLDELDIVHLDIKENNIICRDTGTPIIIDFGISFEKASLNTESHEFQDQLITIFAEYVPFFYPWCDEIQLICYLIDKNLNAPTSRDSPMSVDVFLNLPVDKQTLQEFVDNYFDKEIFGSHSFVDDTKIEAYKKGFHEYINNLSGPNNVSNMTYKEFLSKIFVSDNLKSWDVYSLSICYLKLCQEYFNDIESTYITKLETCLTNIIYSIPTKRKEYVDELYKNFDEYFQEITDEEKQVLANIN